MNARPLDAAARKILLDDAGVEELLAHLRLARGFALFIVPVPTPKIGRALLRLVDEERKVHRGSGATVRALQPHDVLPRTEAPVSVDALAELVLEPLFEGTPNDDRLTWVDATTARPDDDGAWGAVLRMWNERRNSFIAQHRAPLVLVIPYRFERLVADAAPDLWSVRNGVFRVRVADLELHLLPVAKGAQATNGEGTRALSLVLAALSEAPVHFSAPSRALVMSQGAGDMLARGELDQAKALSVGSLAHARAAVAEGPDDVDALRLLYRALGRDAEVDFYRDASASRRSYEEALSVAERIARIMPEAFEPCAMQAETLRQMVVVSGIQPTDAATVDHALERARALLAMHPSAEGVRDQLARTLVLRATLLLESGAERELESICAEIASLRPLADLTEIEFQAMLAARCALSRDLDEAAAHLSDALRRLQTSRSLAIPPTERTRFKRNFLTMLAVAQMRRADFNSAITTAAALADDLQTWSGRYPVVTVIDQLRAVRIRAEAQLELGRIADARSSARELRAMLPPVMDRATLPAAHRVEVAHALAALADIDEDQSTADSLRQEAREILPPAEALAALTQLDYADVRHRLDHVPSPPREPSPDRDTLAA